MSRILIVEDNVDLVFGLRNNLEFEGYEVDAVGDGRQAIEQATVCKYDLMILDLMIPGLNGYQVLRTLRERGFMLPVLILSARDADEDIVRAFRLGADDYVTKPFSLAELLARVEARIRKPPATTPVPKQTHAESESPRGAEHAMPEDTAEGLPPARPLTPRESEVYTLVKEGVHNKAIARRLGITVGTAKIHVHNVLMKLGFHHRAEVRSGVPPSAGEDEKPN